SIPERALHERLGQPDLQLVVVEVGHMDEARRLGRDGGRQLGMRVTQTGDRDAGGHVEVAGAAYVPYPAAVTAHEHDRLLPVVSGQMPLGARDERGLCVLGHFTTSSVPIP